MKSLKILVAVIAMASVLVFLISLVVVVSTDGAHEGAANICAYSLIASFVSLVFYEPKRSESDLVS
ncbi:MAG: hypothetical protein HEP71_02395 [Roseivirga sp.]|nr:hypothetical protein [Roseivirga sp.]